MVQQLERNERRQHKGLQRIGEATHGAQHGPKVGRKNGHEGRHEDEAGADKIDKVRLPQL